MHGVVGPDPLLGLRHQIEAAAQDEEHGDDDRSGQEETIRQERRNAGEEEERESRREEEEQLDEIQRLLDGEIPLRDEPDQREGEGDESAEQADDQRRAAACRGPAAYRKSGLMWRSKRLPVTLRAQDSRQALSCSR